MYDSSRVEVQYLYAHVLWKKICWDFKIGMIYFRRRICDFSVWNIFTLAQREREKKLSKIRSQSRKNMISFSSSPSLSQFRDIVFNLESQNSGSSIDGSPFLSAMRPTWIKHGRKSSFVDGYLWFRSPTRCEQIFLFRPQFYKVRFH